MILSYFEKVKKRIAGLEWLIDREVVESEYDEDAELGIIGGKITFKDGSILHFKEVIFSKGRQYRFQYMDDKNNLIFRWDTAPHHQEVKTFPYHAHTPKGVIECNAMDLNDVLTTIENIIIERFENLWIK
jgi:hypothetical protein